MNKILKILGVVFISIGFLVMGVGIWVKISFDDFMKTALETKATIIDITSKRDSDGDIKHDVIVEFSVNNKKYSGELNYYTSGMRVGKQETIYYNPENPNEFQSKGNNLLFLIPMIIGGVFLVIGSCFILSIILKSRKRKRILSYHYIIQANIVGVQLDTSMSVNGRCPYRLEANYISPDDGKLYTYRSEELWSDLTPILDEMHITTVPVYVNPNNLSEYYVDITELKKFIGN